MDKLLWKLSENHVLRKTFLSSQTIKHAKVHKLQLGPGICQTNGHQHIRQTPTYKLDWHVESHGFNGIRQPMEFIHIDVDVCRISWR